MLQKKLPRLLPAPASLLAQGLVELHKAVKGAGFYPAAHPVRTETMQRTFGLFRGLLTARELVLTVTRQGFLLDGEAVEGNLMVQQLAYDCFVRRIASIVFLQELLFRDLEAFVLLLGCDPHKTAAAGGFARQLEESGTRTIWVNEKNLAVIRAKRAEAGTGEGVAAGEGAREASEASQELAPLEVVAVPPAAPWVESVAELLRLMAAEPADARYQEFGRQLIERVRRKPDEVPLLGVLDELSVQHLDGRRSLAQRESALSTLEQLAEGAADFLLDSLESREFPEKEAVHRVLVALGGKGAGWIIQRICTAEGLFERRSLAKALVSLGRPALAPAVVMLGDGRWYVVRNMVNVIGELRLADAAVALKKPLNHLDLRVRKETVRALLKIAGEPAEALLLTLLEDADQGLVRQAVSALGLLRSRQSVPPLLKLLERRELFQKGVGAKTELLLALGRIGDRRATPRLLKVLCSRGWPLFGRRLEVKIAAAAALGQLGDQAALPALKKLAAGDGPLPGACREALASLGRISGGLHD